MPTTDIYRPWPALGFPNSMAELRRAEAKGPMTEFLRPVAYRDTVHFFDDYILKALDTTNVYTATAGATATTWAIGALEDGNLRGVSGTTAATSGLQLSIPTAAFAGSRNYGMEVRYQISAITEIRIETGFVDALPAVSTNLVNSLATPTFNTVAKGALYVFDNATAVNTAGLYTIGTAVAAAKTAFTTPLPAVSTYVTVRLQVNGNKTTLHVDGQLVAAPSADTVAGADLVKWVFSSVTSNTVSKNIDIDYVRLWKNRNT